ncbi:amino acid adenylation domain-containing protein [Actinokineospora diospyrosa]|uniref:Amino acid adenylation domain-containing protein n=1 Tax=Actinokineospora diospyrosa TaxID=103728 RepID=A0ABT1IPA7_9PSEU|nr:amino acid adenylation domain-containing protein [Actinokineospora diospyrosa]MCP2274384.1 amino acid adenylation domain-containing protein [Actinokineospora diospyrosa]
MSTNAIATSSASTRGGARELPANQLLPELLLGQAVARPHAIAVVDGDRALSFADLVDRACAVAQRLRAAGAGPDTIVGLYLEPSADLVVATWGVLLAGAAYLPLATDYPLDRVSYMIEDSRLAMVVTATGLRADLTELLRGDLPVITVDSIGGGPLERAGGPEDVPRARDAAYVIYTSGTTGRPKGVVVEHGAIANQMAWLRDAVGLDETQSIVRKTPISFDAAQWEVLAPAVGARVVVAPPGAHRDPSSLIETIVANDVTLLQCVPTLLQALVDDDLFARCTSLTAVFSGGEALSRRLATRFAEVLPDSDLVNLYGPTETTINASAHVIPAGVAAGAGNTVSIGKPVHATEFHVLDENGAEVEVGEPGELHIGGVQLARGYLNREEETERRFVTIPVGPDEIPTRLYRTGDLVSRGADGTYQFVGRVDNQVKLRGHRIELDEVRVAIENHDWVRNAAVLVRDDERTGARNLVACVELNPREAALMDQGNHGSHHQSKQGRVQVRAQLGNLGVRTGGGPALALPGKAESARQRQRAFARKTYRFFDGGALSIADVLLLLGHDSAADAESRSLDQVDLASLGSLLRNFGQFHSSDRILPKYGYASPGALYATQLHLEIVGLPAAPDGWYYYHPINHELVRVGEAHGDSARLRVHLLGRKSAIESVYRNNVLEVLRFEAGHLLGLFDEVLPEYGLGVGAGSVDPAAAEVLGADDDHVYLGGYDIVALAQRVPSGPVDTYVQIHPGRVVDIDAGQYRYADGELRRVSDTLVLRKHVIAINQQVYERADLGVSLISRSTDRDAGYIDLGRRLQVLQMNPFGIGFMSSGYSSETGNDLPSARRIGSILREAGFPGGPSYFALGGRVSAEQIAGEGMKEDAVHTQGPAEMIKKDIAGFLPQYMIPARVVIVDAMPYTANGKVDVRALEHSDALVAAEQRREVVAPRTETERRIAAAWAKVMKTDDISVRDDFFVVGGNSLLAVLLIQEVNRAVNTTLPVQLIFDEPTVEGLARRVDERSHEAVSRLITLQPKGSGAPVVCWPGLGGYPMNLKPLALAMGQDRPFLGVQAAGINDGETPHQTVAEMARHDVDLIRQVQPHGPYTLWGYSFGARVAFEAAHQLEQAGEVVEQVVLIAPGSPIRRAAIDPGTGGLYGDPAFVTLLYSVFAGRITGPDVDDCVAATTDEAGFVAFVAARQPRLDVATIRRVVAIVRASYSFRYTFEEMLHRRVAAPITILKVRGDDYSFVEEAVGALPSPPTVLELDVDHYGVLRAPDVDRLAATIRDRTRTAGGPVHMPHVNIKHFPVQLSTQQQGELVTAISKAITEAMGVSHDAVSIALEPIPPQDWHTSVYEPEIERRSHLLAKTPNY